MALKFKVLHSEWIADGETFSANDNEKLSEEGVEGASPELIRLAGAAHHAGAIEVFEDLVDDHVQTQEDGEAALVEAQGEWIPPAPRDDGTIEPGRWTGPWGEANAAQAEADAGAYAEALVGIDIEPTETLEVSSSDVANVDDVLGKGDA